MQTKLIKIILTVLKSTLITVTALLLIYAVLFSITGTILIYKGYRTVITPIRQVQELKNFNPKETSFMNRYRKQLVSQGEPDSLFHIFTPLDSISIHLKKSVIAAEDDGFYTHPGVDLNAIIQASEYNRTTGEFKRGASTLTQQVAKNLFLSGEKNFQRKAKELCYALLMENYLGKDRILELYLNYAQWGKNIFGCEAASQYYFKKKSSQLNRNEAARLAAVLAKPSKMTPFHKTVFMGKRLSVIANNLYLHKLIDDEEFFGLTGALPNTKDSVNTNSKNKEKNSIPSVERLAF